MHTGILTDGAIRHAVETGDIEIEPFNPEHVNVTSVDLTLGRQVSVYKDWVKPIRRPLAKPPGQPIEYPPPAGDGRDLLPQYGLVDSKKPLETLDYEMDPEIGWVLKPGIGYLMHTAERIKTMKYNPILDGKSSVGRLFLQVHATAGYGDPGFDGNYTLEVIVQHPVRVYPGMRICQIRFQTLFTGVEGVTGPLRTYDKIGHYTAEKAQGAVASQVWKQFK